MTDDRWQDIRTLIEEQFAIEEDKKVPTDDKLGHIEIIIFNAPQGRIKLERTSHPKSMGTKTQYSKRIGSDVSVEHVYSDTEIVNTLRALLWNDAKETWEEINPDAFLDKG